MLHFAPRYGLISPCLVRPSRWTGPVCPPASNDNARDPAVANDFADPSLAAALRLFAAHGLSAAERACEAAEIAGRSGDAEGVMWWLDVCRTLDRGKARAASRRLARAT